MDDKFLERLRLIADRKKLSYSKLGSILGVSKDTAGNYLTGRTEISIEDAKKLAIELGEDPVWLFTGKISLNIEENENPYGTAKAGRPPIKPYKSEVTKLLAPITNDLPDDTYRLFQVEGNSMMHSINQGDWLLCKKDSVKKIVNGRVYVLVLTNDLMNEYRHSGVWVKRCYLRDANNYISCKSDYVDSTEPYITFRIKTDEISECWYPVLKVTGHMSDPNKDLYDRLDELESRIELLESLNE